LRTSRQGGIKPPGSKHDAGWHQEQHQHRGEIWPE
jgi:hypothetical protein